jgi:1-acyl-sn-glycerol-3-phosphate acyltransferase
VASWLFAGPDDELSRRIAARLGMAWPASAAPLAPEAATAPAAPERRRFVPAAGRASAGNAAAVAYYAAAFADEGAGLSSDGAVKGALANGAVKGAWDAVVYRPPRRAGPRVRRDLPDLPDLNDAGAFLDAFLSASTGAAGRRPPRLVLLSSAAAVSPGHHHPGYVAESERPPGHNPIAAAWLDLEALAARRLGGPGSPGAPELIVLRPAAVAARDGEDALCRMLRGRAAVVPPGFDPTVQLLSPDDLAAAIECALERGAGKPGIYHVAPAGAVPVRAALRLAGVRRLPLGWLGGGRLDYLRHGWTVSGDKIRRELGFTPRATSAAAVVAAFGGRTGLPGSSVAAAAAAAAPASGTAPSGTPPAGTTPSGTAPSGTPPSGTPPSAAAPSGPPPAPETSGGVPDFDPYGLDKRYIAAYGRTLFRFLHDGYWRIEHEGLEHVPRQGRAVLTGVHRGFMPWDGVMALHLIARELGRHPRFLIHPCLVKFPFLANYMTKLGGIIACQENADWVLGQGELLGMFPEGIQGAFTMYRDAYRLGRFGRDEYVKMALRQGAPIVPFVTVGSAEIYPILGRVDSKLVRRVTEWPFLPIAPNFPLPGLPLPSKWHTRFLEPLPVDQLYPPEAAEDPEVVRAISREVRARMEAAIQGMLARRKSIFFGSILAE